MYLGCGTLDAGDPQGYGTQEWSPSQEAGYPGTRRGDRWSTPSSRRLSLRIRQTLGAVVLPKGALSSRLSLTLCFPCSQPRCETSFHPPARTISGCCFSASSRCRVSPGLPGLPGAAGASRRTFLGRSGAACSLSRRKGRGRRVVGKPGTGRGPPWIVPNGIGSAAAAYLWNSCALHRQGLDPLSWQDRD